MNNPDMTTAMQALLDAFVSTGQRLSRGNIQQPEPEGKGLRAGVRYWGNWCVPDGEKDDGDYDWKELTPASRQRAVQIVANLQKRFPTVKLSFSQEEKNWISLNVD